MCVHVNGFCVLIYTHMPTNVCMVSEECFVVVCVIVCSRMEVCSCVDECVIMRM